MVTLGIVTPYYQKTPGVLQRTARSVAAQTAIDSSASVVWWIIDDGSPVAASAELANFQPPPWLDVRIEKTANSGIAAARNRGLDRLRGHCDYIAFLDSDDTWAPEHAARALSALNDTRDFYFSNYVKLGKRTATFELLDFEPQRFPQAPNRDLFYPDSASVFDAIVKRNPVWTTTVVARATLLDTLRFETRLQRAGEDYVYWMKCSQRTNGLVASARCEAFAGEGVNVFARAKQWGDPGTSARAAAGLRCVGYVKHHFTLSQEQTAHLDRHASKLRREIASNVLHALRLGRWREAFVLADAFRLDKRLAADVIRHIAHRAAH